MLRLAVVLMQASMSKQMQMQTQQIQMNKLNNRSNKIGHLTCNV
jgi:hypothetical protein